MKIYLTIIGIFLSLFSICQEFKFDYHSDFDSILQLTNDSSSHLYYETLLNRFNRNDTTLSDFEVLALLIGFTDNECFKPYDYIDTERRIYQLNDDGKYNEAKAVCDSFLVKVPVSQSALIEKSYAFHKLNLSDSADYYFWRNMKIMYAMFHSGDGLTPETAFFSLGPSDGQNFIKKFLRCKIGTMGSIRDKYGNFIDVLELVYHDENTDEETRKLLYFQIEHAAKRMFSDDDIKIINEIINKDQEK